MTLLCLESRPVDQQSSMLTFKPLFLHWCIREHLVLHIWNFNPFVKPNGLQLPTGIFSNLRLLLTLIVYLMSSNGKIGQCMWICMELFDYFSNLSF